MKKTNVGEYFFINLWGLSLTLLLRTVIFYLSQLNQSSSALVSEDTILHSKLLFELKKIGIQAATPYLRTVVVL